MKEKNISENKVKIYFHGASGEVTGSNYLLELEAGDGKKTKVLIDCGLYQGGKVCEDKNREPFPYDPASLDAVIVTHAHLDHIGRVPKLKKDGFKGKIYSTYPTKDFANLMLTDSLGVLTKEAAREGLELIYEEKDVQAAMAAWEAKEYEDGFTIGGLSFLLRDAGHILGSAIVEVKLAENADSKKIVFSGDLGNSPEPLLRETSRVKDANYLIIESTYGDRLHEDRAESDLKLERMIEDIVVKNGVLMIPAFSLERTQKILFQINNLIENGRIPKIPVFLDSPLSIKATMVYKGYSKYYNNDVKEIMLEDDDLFSFTGLVQTLETEESKSIANKPSPKIIIAGSGMLNGGRILHHAKKYLPDKNNVLLLVSYQAAGSLGRQLQEGAKAVSIMGETVPVLAKVAEMGGYSSHADANGLFSFVDHSADTLLKIFVAHGELKAGSFFAQRLKDYAGLDATVVKSGDCFEVEL
ncbi:TPA: hypothetical protein DEW47_01770 [Patescibacteria group bacterium]|nr:MAG: RNA-metabolising metallo-beta-lactamase [Parcubacteria group bacterium GW2011_GWF2_40_10]KKR47460.1 MAG: RNA-metabolising metallo-beta-lactamase [Parcubacteria group bacterium GW2011_GWA2_40_143]KKR59881.1 MAG: RNA-metabolising metallo-beta-lactamase [Parcubacteria group bacterium GW2011_GWC2_40_31]KKR80959.1 MAG: RNA-metabolising metallo-beta-lactamase [Parcubacteria group bacterium GW2011_GWD2_40_9]HBB56590.1 hypothetical protein [Patescibacteria group bacterium]